MSLKLKNLLLVSILIVLVLILCFFGETGFSLNDEIIKQIRFPKILSCVLGGGIISIAGLLMQIYFQNPLAGPDVLGVTSGSILSVAIWSLVGINLPPWANSFNNGIVAFIGAIIVFFFLISFTNRNSSKTLILIIGILISSFVSSIISVLINLSQSMPLKNFLIWSQGSFRNLTINEVPIFLLSIFSIFILLYLSLKKISQFMLGESYAQTIGLDINRVKRIFIFIVAISVAIVTVFCGPIGFIGIVAPFLTKRIFKTANLKVLYVGTFLIGATFACCSDLIMIIFSFIPLTTNSILGVLGAPILVYFMFKNKEQYNL